MQYNNEDLLKQYKENKDEESINKLYQNNINIIYYIINRNLHFKHYFNNRSDIDIKEDINYIYDLSFTLAINNYNYDCNNKFISFLHIVITNELYKFIRHKDTMKEKLNDRMFKTEDLEFDIEKFGLFEYESERQNDKYFEFDENELKKNLHSIMKEAFPNKKPTTRKKLVDYCFLLIKGYTITEIANKRNVSKQYVWSLLKNSNNKKLKECLLKGEVTI